MYSSTFKIKLIINISVCGSVEKKKMLRAELESNPLGTELAAESIPDTNVIACLIKDFLRELPEPLISPQIHGMLLEAASVALPNDVQTNRHLVLKIIDCLQLSAKNCLLLVLDHLSTVLCSSPHNGLTPTRLSLVSIKFDFFSNNLRFYRYLHHFFSFVSTRSLHIQYHQHPKWQQSVHSISIKHLQVSK